MAFVNLTNLNISVRRRTLFLVGAASLTILLVIACSAYSAMYLREQDERSATESTAYIARSLVLTVDALIDKINIVLINSAAHLVTILPESPETGEYINTYLQGQQGLVSDIAYIRITDERGDVIYGSGVVPHKYKSSDHNHLQDFLAEPSSRLIVGTPLQGRITDEWVWPISRPIIDKKGQFRGVIYAVLICLRLKELLNHVDMKAGASVSLRDQNMGIIARNTYNLNDPAMPGDRNISTKFANAVIKNPRDGSFISDGTASDKYVRLYSYKKSDKYGFTVTVGFSYDNIIADSNKHTYIISALALFVILSSVSFSIVVSRYWSSLERSALSHRRDARFIKTITDHLPGLVAYLNKDEVCRFANKGHLDWFGVEPSLMLGNSIEKILGAEMYALAKPHIKGALQGHRQNYEMNMKTYDGGHAVAWMQYIPDIGETGAIAGIFILGTDITKLHQAMEGLEKANRDLEISRNQAAAGNRAKSIFISLMSHELRTPINGITGMAQILVNESRPDKKAEFCKMLCDAASNLNTVLSDILKYASTETFSIKINTEKFDPNLLATDVCNLFVAAAREKNNIIDVVSMIDVDRRFIGDVNNLRHVLGNVVNNANKFTRSGKVSVRISETQTLDLTYLLFEVEDTGIGFSMDNKDTIFKPFSQIEDILTRVHGGTGLGLAICEKLVELMGGTLGVESEIGVGSRFWFTCVVANCPDDKC